MKYVAEISANHLGQKLRAFNLVNAAASAGATHVKFQTFNPEQMVVTRHTLKGGPWSGRDLKELYQEAVTPREWHQELFDYARSLGVVPFSAPFHPDDVAFLESIDCPVYKVASCELVYMDLLKAIAKTQKPVILSTGMATFHEINAAVNHLRQHGSTDITLLKCTAAYPAQPADANLITMVDLASVFECEVGLSDHTLGHEVAATATASGASVIEKHLTLYRGDGGPDAAFSLEPDEFRAMVDRCNEVLDMLGHVQYGAVDAEQGTCSLRRSLWFVRDLPSGYTITDKDIAVARPADGLPPHCLDQVVGQVLIKPVLAGTPVTEDVMQCPTLLTGSA